MHKKPLTRLLVGSLCVWLNLLASTAAPAQSREETALWAAVKDSKDPEDYKAYLDKYPEGAYVPLAKRRIASLGAGASSAHPQASAPPAVNQPPDKSLPTDEAANAEVDTGFKRWSAGWMFDRYVAGSAHTTERGFKDGTYVVRGIFDFLRSGARLSIPFAAAYSKVDAGYALSNLCYNDTTSGTTDCINPSNPGAMQSRQFLGSIVLLGLVGAMSEERTTCVKRYTFFGEAYLVCN